MDTICLTQIKEINSNEIGHFLLYFKIVRILIHKAHCIFQLCQSQLLGVNWFTSYINATASYSSFQDYFKCHIIKTIVHMCPKLNGPRHLVFNNVIRNQKLLSFSVWQKNCRALGFPFLLHFLLVSLGISFFVLDICLGNTFWESFL